MTKAYLYCYLKHPEGLGVCELKAGHKEVDPLSRSELLEAADKAVKDLAAAKGDPVKHPSHYTSHPSGVECLTITRHMNFSLGNAVKYIWRAGLKSKDPVQDLEKAVFYLQDEIRRLQGT